VAGFDQVVPIVGGSRESGARRSPPRTREFPPTSVAVGAARRFVLDTLGPDRAERPVVALLVSELATNAVRHARTSFVVAVSVDDKVHAEISDRSPLPPRLAAAPDPLHPGGRGLVLVDELAVAWGYQLTAEGKTVWFETGRHQS
jgi:anti-sigma regulatory factor (Ser/Thr protein kinase)